VIRYEFNNSGEFRRLNIDFALFWYVLSSNMDGKTTKCDAKNIDFVTFGMKTPRNPEATLSYHNFRRIPAKYSDSKDFAGNRRKYLIQIESRKIVGTRRKCVIIYKIVGNRKKSQNIQKQHRKCRILYKIVGIGEAEDFIWKW
jgi:hypothetical protein